MNLCQIHSVHKFIQLDIKSEDHPGCLMSLANFLISLRLNDITLNSNESEELPQSQFVGCNICLLIHTVVQLHMQGWAGSGQIKKNKKN